MIVAAALVHRATLRPVVDRLEVADGYWSRLAGLQFRRSLARGSGLLLVGCRSVHTCFVRFPLELVMLDAGGRVVEVRRSVPPWRAVCAAAATHAILEARELLAPVAPGDELILVPRPVPLRASLAFLCPQRE